MEYNPEAVPPRAVTAAMRALTGEIEALEKQLGLLHAQLLPVLTAGTQSDRASQTSPPMNMNVSTPLSSELDEWCGRIVSIGADVADMRDHLGV